MGSVIVMILGSILLYGGVIDAATRLSVNGINVFFAGLGIFVIWLGARRRQNWPIPLGITWIVLGIMICMIVPVLRLAPPRPGDLQMSQRANAHLTAGISFVILGGLFILLKRRATAAHLQGFVRHSQRMKLSRVCYFFCSKCNHVFKKEDNLRGWKIAIMTADNSPSVSGTLTCQYCGNVIQCQEIYSGKYDVPKQYWPDLSPPHEI